MPCEIVRYRFCVRGRACGRARKARAMWITSFLAGSWALRIVHVAFASGDCEVCCEIVLGFGGVRNRWSDKCLAVVRFGGCSLQVIHRI